MQDPPENSPRARTGSPLVVAAAVAVALLGSGVALYVGLSRGGGPAGTGVPAHPPVAASPGGGAMPGAMAPGTDTPAGKTYAGLDVMAERLAKRLDASGGRPEDWELLGRTYSELERFQDAARAFDKALEGRPGDAKLVALRDAARAKAGAPAR